MADEKAKKSKWTRFYRHFYCKVYFGLRIHILVVYILMIYFTYSNYLWPLCIQDINGCVLSN